MIREGTLFLELHLVGESFDNDDGTSRQTEISRCKPGEPVSFTLQPDNPHDPNAILVLSQRGIGLGYVPKAHCVQLKKQLDTDFYEKARIAHIIGGVPGKPSRGVMVVLTAKGSRYRIGGKVPFNPELNRLDRFGVVARRPERSSAKRPPANFLEAIIKAVFKALTRR